MIHEMHIRNCRCPAWEEHAAECEYNKGYDIPLTIDQYVAKVQGIAKAMSGMVWNLTTEEERETYRPMTFEDVATMNEAEYRSLLEDQQRAEARAVARVMSSSQVRQKPVLKRPAAVKSESSQCSSGGNDKPSQPSPRTDTPSEDSPAWQPTANLLKELYPQDRKSVV